MDIGRVGLWTFLLDQHPTPRVREVAREIEAMGWPTLWRPESSGRDVLISASVLLEATSKLIVASGIAQIYARHPVTMVAAQKTLFEAHEGRFLLGLGVAHAPSVEGIRKLEYKTPYSDMVAYLRAMVEAPFMAVEPATRPPTVLAALGPRMLRLSAEAADGAHPYFTTPEHTAMARGIMGDGPLLAPEQMVVIDTDLERARSVARAGMARYLRLPNYTNNLLRCGFTQSDIDNVTDRLVDRIVACGDLEVTMGRVQEHFDAGADHVCIQVLVADNDLDVTMEQWRLLADAFELGGEPPRDASPTSG
jgi:probable F420-dependent oxidoreductase